MRKEYTDRWAAPLLHHAYTVPTRSNGLNVNEKKELAFILEEYVRGYCYLTDIEGWIHRRITPSKHAHAKNVAVRYLSLKNAL